MCDEVLPITVFDDGVEIGAVMTVAEYEKQKSSEYLNDFAKADGFDDWPAMLEYFKDDLGETLWWIRWKKDTLVPCGQADEG